MRTSQSSLGILFILALWGTAPAALYSVGLGQPYTTIGAVPLETLGAGDTLLIYWNPAPYREKFVLAGDGTAQAPLVVRGVRGPQGQRPVLDGENATTRTALDFWSEGRGVVKVGGSSRPSGGATHIRIEGLEIRNARLGVAYTDRRGNAATYLAAASAIFVESGSDITVSDCVLHSCGNGFFTAHASARVLLQFSHLYGNGYENDIYHHNSYTESRGITFVGNHFGLLWSGSPGNNLKDRSVGTRIVNNWIEGGNRQLDLVESSNLSPNSYLERLTHVYGNILIEPPGAGNRQIVHFGGDGGDTSRYRDFLQFSHNTVISRRTDATTLFRLLQRRQEARAFNNVFYTRHSGNTLYLQDGNGQVKMGSNWLREGFRTHPTDASLLFQDFGSNFYEITATQSASVRLFSRYTESDAEELSDVDLRPPLNSVLALRARGLDTDTGDWFGHNREYVLHLSTQTRGDASYGHAMRTVGAYNIIDTPTPLYIRSERVQPWGEPRRGLMWQWQGQQYRLDGRAW